MRPHRTISWLALAVLASCAPYSTMHTADTLAKGETRFRISASYPTEFFEDESVNAELLLYGVSVGHRFGLADRVDMGVKMGVIESFSVDFKYKFIDGPIMLSGDLGLSALTFDDFTVGVHPMVVAGTEVFYAGFKSLNFPPAHGNALLGWFLGLRVGKTVKVIPEISIFREGGTDDQIVFVGLGLELPNTRD